MWITLALMIYIYIYICRSNKNIFSSHVSVYVLETDNKFCHLSWIVFNNWNEKGACIYSYRFLQKAWVIHIAKLIIYLNNLNNKLLTMLTKFNKLDYNLHRSWQLQYKKQILNKPVKGNKFSFITTVIIRIITSVYWILIFK